MGEYGFFAAQLRFVAARTTSEAPELKAMMAELGAMADCVETTGQISVTADKLRLAGRALAGVAGFLQQHILPEAVAAGNARGEAQIRWVIDTSMEFMAKLTVHAEQSQDGGDLTLDLPPPPELSES